MSKKLAVYVKSYRLNKGITQKELSTRTGIPLVTIKRIECNSIKEHRLSTLSKLADGINVNVMILLLKVIERRDD